MDPWGISPICSGIGEILVSIGGIAAYRVTDAVPPLLQVLLSLAALTLGADSPAPAPAPEQPDQAPPQAPRAKKDVFLASPYYTTLDEIGAYYPKYERAAAYVAAGAVPAVAQSVAVPAYSAYSAYPYAYSAYPAYRHVVIR